MNYPNGPYGQGFPGYPPGYPAGYPQQPGYPGGYPPHQPAPMPPASPSGATGITAGVLAGLGGMANLFIGLLGLLGLAGLAELSRTPAYDDAEIFEGVFGLVAVLVLLVVGCGLLLLAGTVLLLRRTMVGRWLVVAGCALTILIHLIGLGINAAAAARYEYYDGSGTAVLHLVFAIATLVLALLPSTTRWIQAKQQPVAPPYYPLYPG